MQINANYYSVTPSRFIAGTVGSYGIEKLEIKFSEEWEGLAKKVVFYPPDAESVGVIYNSEPIYIPMEVMKRRGKTRYAIIGYRDEKRLITVCGEIDVLGTLEDTVNASYVPTPDEMTQVLTYMQKAVDTASSVREDADNGVFDGRDSNRWFIGMEIDGTYDTIIRNIEGALVYDMYLNSDNYNLYRAKDQGIWTYIGNIKGEAGRDGEKGDQGEKGDKGDRGEQGIQGEKGDPGSFSVAGFEVDTSTGMLVMTASENFDDMSFEVNTNGYLEVY